MTITLLKPNTWPPGGYQFVQPQIPWVNPMPLASVDHITDLIVTIRQRNPRHKLSTDFETCRQELLEYNYLRLGASASKYFLTDSDVGGVKKNSSPSLSDKVAGLAATVKRVFTGSKTLIEAFGGGGHPVAQELADARAATCIKCPLNVNKGETFTALVAGKIKDLVQAKEDLQLHAKGEASLHVCDACGCHIPLKVWTPLNHIIENLPAEDYAKLDSQCWIHDEERRLALVLPFCVGDFEDAILLLDWMRELGGLRTRKCLLVADCKLSASSIAKAEEKARTTFAQFETIRTPHSLPDEAWPAGANWMWLTAAERMSKSKNPWFWCEPDCIPLRAGWLDELEKDYRAFGKPYMGCLVKRESVGTPELPDVHLNGNAVYPADAFKRIGHKVKTARTGQLLAFDLATADSVAQYAAHTNLIQHFWGEKNLPPVFVERPAKGDSKNSLPISFIRTAAAVFHRSKSGQLIRLLQKQSQSFTVVITSHQRPEHLKKAFESCLIAGVRNIVVTATGDLSLMRGVFDDIAQSKSDVVILKHNPQVTSNQSWFLGVEAADTDYVMLLHDDDLLLPDYASIVKEGIRAKAPFIMVQARNHGVPDYIISESETDGIEDVEELRRVLECKGNLSISPGRGVFLKDDLAAWLRECESMPASCYLRPGFLVGNDLVLWLRAIKKYRSYFNVPKPGVSFLHWPGSTTVTEIAKPSRAIFKIYDTAREWRNHPKVALAKSPIHILTIVLDGMPFITQHLEVFSRLARPWRWHIVEGAAMNTHCTKWCQPQAARLSKDGTTEYLDSIAEHPRIQLYRKPIWDGKIEMVNAPLAGIAEECVLLEVDCDEFWTAEQIENMAALFDSDRAKSHAMFWCRYWFGPHLVMNSRNCYANDPSQDWKRAWRFKPGDRFLTHEPPLLSSESKPFLHHETNGVGLVFDHYGYKLRSQVEFKERFYGYIGAVGQWERLQSVKSGTVKLSDYLKWINPKISGTVSVTK